MTDFFFRRNDIFPVDTEVGAYDALDVIAPEGRPPPQGLVDTQTMTSEGLVFSNLEETGRYWAVGLVDSNYRWMGFFTAISQDPLVGPTGDSGERWFTGEGTPSEGLGAIGDFYLDSTEASDVTPVNTDLTNVKDYGALGDGSTDDTTAIQDAVDACEAAGGGTVFFPSGIYEVVGTIVVPEGVVLSGVSRETVTLGTAAAGATYNTSIVQLYGDGSGIEGVTVDAAGHPGAIAVRVHRDDSAATVIARNFVRNCRILNTDERDACRVPRPSADFSFEGNRVEDCFSGMTMYGDDDADTTGVRIVGNRFRGTGGTTGSNVQLFTYVPTYGLARLFDGVLIAGNDFRDFPDPAQNIPVEVTGCANIICEGNYFATATRGISSGECTNLVIANNVFVEQTVYAVELNAGKNIVIDGNVAQDCTSFAQQSNNVGVLEDVVISDNLIIGGPSSVIANNYMVKLYDIGGLDAKRFSITGNVFTDCVNASGCIRVGGGTGTVHDVLIEGNLMYSGTASTTPIIFATFDRVNRAKVIGNMATVARNLVAGDDYNAVIQIPTANCNYVAVENNDIYFTGTTAGRHVEGVGSGGGPFSATGMVIRNNRVVGSAGIVGIEVNNSSADYLREGNDVRTCGIPNSPTDFPVTASAATITLPLTSDIHSISGTTNITSVTADKMNRRVTLVFQGALTFTDGSNLKLAGNFVTTADDTITLACDGTNWIEVGRSVN